jgi:pseudouridine-5'-phosphate glycosidase
MISVSEEVATALRQKRPVVALESTLISHGLPWPTNLETAMRAEAAVREQGAVPATIAVVDGTPTVGITREQAEHLASSKGVHKASRRDLAVAVARREWAATTVSATMLLAHKAGIGVFATGGIGGVHPGPVPDVSADLTELGRTPVAVVCAGAKSVLDLPATLEMLETLGVPVVGYGTDEFPAFYSITSGLRAPARADSPVEAARMVLAHWALGGAGVVIAQPPPRELALGTQEVQQATETAEAEARKSGISGPARTPFLLSRLAELTGGRTLAVNQTLISANAGLAARLATAVRQEQP